MTNEERLCRAIRHVHIVIHLVNALNLEYGKYKPILRYLKLALNKLVDIHEETFEENKL